MDIRTKYTFLQRRHMWLKVYKKGLSITNYQRNSNKNYNWISHKTSKNGDHQDLQEISDGEAVEKKEPPTLLVCQEIFNRRIPMCCFSQVLCFFLSGTACCSQELRSLCETGLNLL